MLQNVDKILKKYYNVVTAFLAAFTACGPRKALTNEGG
jgi:hypothetical protein